MGARGNRISLPSLLRDMNEVHQQSFNSLVNLLQSHMDLEVARIRLAIEELCVAEIGEAGKVDLELVQAIKHCKNVAENEIRKFECLTQYLFAEPTPARVTFVNENLGFCPFTRTNIS